MAENNSDDAQEKQELDPVTIINITNETTMFFVHTFY